MTHAERPRDAPAHRSPVRSCRRRSKRLRGVGLGFPSLDDGGLARGIPSELVRELILAELDTGEKSRKHLDAIALEKLGANPDTVYKSGLKPLQDAKRVKPRKDGLAGDWYWRVGLGEVI